MAYGILNTCGKSTTVRDQESPYVQRLPQRHEDLIAITVRNKPCCPGFVPLSPYYFWPRKDAWEELRTKLESKSWISKKRTIILLNQATDITNLWQQTSSAGQ